MLPHTSEVRLVREVRRLLVGEDQVLLLNDLGGQFAKSVPFSLEGFTTLGGGGVKTEDDVGVLVGMGERMQSAVLLGLVLGVGEQVTTVGPPGLNTFQFWHFVVEESGAVTASPLLHSEPLKGVRFLTLTSEGGGGPLGVHILHGILPSLSRVGIDFPAVLLLSGCPVGDFEALEEGTGLSVETDSTDTLEEGIGVEVLGIDVMHNVRLLVEFVGVDVLNAHAYNN